MSSCSECLYFSKWKKGTSADLGDCHANPPVMFLTYKDSTPDFKALRSRVRATDLACIHYKQDIPF